MQKGFYFSYRGGQWEGEKAESRERASGTEEHFFRQGAGVGKLGLQRIAICSNRWVRIRGHKGLVDKAIMESTMRLQQISGEKGCKITADLWRTKFEPEGCEIYKK